MDTPVSSCSLLKVMADGLSGSIVETWISNRSRWLALQLLLMADSPYLLAIALFTQNGKRVMPLGGRSLLKDATEGDAGACADSP